MENLQKFGPVGNNCGGQIWDEKGQGDIVQISVSYDIRRDIFESGGIRALQFQCQKDGKLGTNLYTVGDSKFSGKHLRTITLESPWEYITGVEGILGGVVIESLTIKTNRATYGPSGDKSGNSFSYEFGPGNQFGGFHGTSNRAGISSIGVYVKTVTSLPSRVIGNGK